MDPRRSHTPGLEYFLQEWERYKKGSFVIRKRKSVKLQTGMQSGQRPQENQRLFCSRGMVAVGTVFDCYGNISRLETGREHLQVGGRIRVPK